MSEGVDWINKKLIEYYGLDINLSIPKYRIVWTTSQIEKRFDIYNVYSEGGIFLRQERGVFEVPKYTGFPDLWSLEDIQSTSGNPYLERIVRWSYEPIWIFGAGNSDRQPNWRAVYRLIENKRAGHDPNWIPKSPADIERDEENRMAKEKALFKTMLQNDSPIIATKLASGSAVLNALDSKEMDKGVDNGNTDVTVGLPADVGTTA